MIKKITITLLAFSLASCFSFGEKAKKSNSGLGERNIQYYANKTVTSLEIPPDLTKPDSQEAFRLSEYVANIQEDTLNFSKNDVATKKAASVVNGSTKVKVKRLGQIRWIVIDKKVDAVWSLAKSFFKSHGFAIKRSDKKIGVMETNFLENHPEIPDQSVGLIRSMLKKATKARYALPIIDKYRMRIEPTDNGKKTEVHFTLNSMEEVITNAGGEDENTIWQARPKDQSLETEMLYRFTVYLGSDHTIARKKITNTKGNQIVKVEIVKGVGGYAKLKFALGKHETWANVGWALDELNIDVEDKDIKEGSFYVNVAKEKDKGVVSRIFGDNAIKESYQIIVRQISSHSTEVTFNDLSEENEQETIDFSYELLNNISKQFQ
ncbi:outer membrane protein assembly factor BamC [bacterium endosymbiont of Bathymodiolus sp. 5 South]|jgi:outer membrane protein assembly factor BamC|uniref:outer membrane protein assembly factor BamC n=1 Tax=bacterium endosymbiont of Bathymodiolus sp. 5 South TaxID=1181670 RepID=UPI0010B3B917|nr:outer membrane protein assembly factor BamC [bacterium endosymbiont of Bathymodiolus sp. 5 South]CAC9640813.1 Outer membrane beta-barrel assembly protein BamC; Lipoprotein-34 precursor [uncultured Gammaproteobacteria bacterium]SHN90189.1 Outer membrane beta-barrel assembly protein BamC; Lipoprotein-34 precursor [bacterium endosymbiont of Bathymodiolus sp. 5 South]SSC08873.1 Outer membrane protein NlpB, lipoprotein component of the protein assembly complex (forms a complex with YaeT, YfiO, and